VGGVVVGALTAGVGLLAGMIVVGMGAAGGGAAVALSPSENSVRSLILACDSYHEAECWVNSLEAQIHSLGDQLLGLPNISSPPAARSRSHTHAVRPEVRLRDVQSWISSSRWRIFDVYEGVRLLQLASIPLAEGAAPSKFFAAPPPSAAAPCMRVNIGINGSTSDTFSRIINFSNSLQTGLVRSMRIVENVDNFTDVIHLKLEPLFLYPSWTAPRDFCLMRYWRDNFDGSYVVCLDSTPHPDCPLVEGFVRAELHAAYVVAPPRVKLGGYGANYAAVAKDVEDEDGSECLLSFIAQLNPKGWVWQSLGYTEAFLKEFMLHVLDVRDALDAERFQQVQFDPVNKVVGVTVVSPVATMGTVATVPPIVLAPAMWMDSDAASFRVRARSYNSDKLKTPSSPALFKFIGIDLFETVEAHRNIAANPKNRVHQAMLRGEDSWLFVVNIMVPGTPYLNFVCYFQGDRSLIEADTPFGRIARPFFNGNDDEFRNNRFKLIPKVVDGNLMIKMAVKDTPTLLGNKLKQYYYKGDNYFELDVDVGSSSVARNVVGLAIGYSKAIVVDLGFCLQGNEENELPEVLMGCCSCYHVDMSTGTKL